MLLSAGRVASRVQPNRQPCFEIPVVLSIERIKTGGRVVVAGGVAIERYKTVRRVVVAGGVARRAH